jgi:N-ethylmaleimide reductase
MLVLRNQNSTSGIAALMYDVLLSPFQLGRIELKNRAVMSPMTRSRALGNVPGELQASYYGQRAGDAGLIVTEGTSPSPDGLGYPRIPGLFNAAQVRGWRLVTEAVRARGGRIFVQLMHTGRVTHQGNLPGGGRVLAPSVVALPGQTMWVDSLGAQVPLSPSIEMTEGDIEHAIEEYVTSAKLAIEAGFDGVELHGANGYLMEQFLNATSNLRTDGWGGSIEKRARFGFEVARRTAAAIGGDRLGIRLSPYGVNGGIKADPEVETSYPYFAERMRDAGLVYVHVVDHSALGAPPVSDTVKAAIRARFGGTIILAGGYDLARAEADLEAKKGELVAFGRPYLANADYFARARAGRALNAADFATFYTPGPKGYTDYP